MDTMANKSDRARDGEANRGRDPRRRVPGDRPARGRRDPDRRHRPRGGHVDGHRPLLLRDEGRRAPRRAQVGERAAVPADRRAPRPGGRRPRAPRDPPRAVHSLPRPAREEWVFFLELWGWILHRPELLADGATLDSRWRGYFVEIVRSGTANGAFRPVAPPEEVADRLVAVVDGLGLKAVLGQPWMTPERMRAILIRFAADELRRSRTRRSSAPPRSARRRPRARARPGVRRRRPRAASTPGGGRARASPTRGPGAARRGRRRGAGDGPARARTRPPAGGRRRRRPRARAVPGEPLRPPEHRDRLARDRRVGDPRRPDPLAGRELDGFSRAALGAAHSRTAAPAPPSSRRERQAPRHRARGEEGDPPHAGRYYHRPRPRAREASVLERLFSPLRVGPVELPNRIVSTAHQTTLVHEQPSDGGLRRLPRGPRARRHRADRPRGHGRPPSGPADAAHARPATGRRSCRRWPASPRRCTPTGRGSSCSSSTAGGSRSPTRRGRRRSLPPRSPASASTSSRARSPRARSSESSRGTREGGAGRPGRPRRGRDLGRARVPGRAVLHARAEPARRRVGRAGSLPARGAGAVRAAAPGLALGVRLSADSEAAAGGRRRRRRPRRLRERRPRRLLDLPRLDRHRAAAAAARERDRRADRAVPGRPAARRHVADRRPRRGGPARRRRALRRDRDDARAHHRSGAAAQGARGPARRRPPLHRLQRLHRALPRRHPDRVRAEPAHRARADAGPSGALGRPGGASSWWAGARRASPRPPRRGRPGTRSSSSSAATGSAGRSRSPGRRRCTPSSRARSPATTTACSLAAGVEIRLETEADAESVAALAPDAVVVAAGARPYEPDLPLDGIEAVQAWDVLRGPRPRGRRVLVADWGGDAAGLACAELLDAAGNDVTVAVGSAALGETLHQYQRNLYAAPALPRRRPARAPPGARRRRARAGALPQPLRPRARVGASGRPARPRAGPGPRARLAEALAGAASRCTRRATASARAASRRRSSRGRSRLRRPARSPEPVELRAAVAEDVVPLVPGLVAGAGERSQSATTSPGPKPGGGPASSQPYSSQTTLPPTHSTPRSGPVRSQTATKTWFRCAVAMAFVTSIGRSPSGRGCSGKFAGSASRSAPARARPRATSGKLRS